jgi:hypothetical protein
LATGWAEEWGQVKVKVKVEELGSKSAMKLGSKSGVELGLMLGI